MLLLCHGVTFLRTLLLLFLHLAEYNLDLLLYYTLYALPFSRRLAGRRNQFEPSLSEQVHVVL